MDICEIREAHRRIKPFIRQTPLYSSSFYSRAVDGDVYLKLENLQEIGSFKIRGALNRMLQLNEDERERGVLTASAGNHGQGLALSAKLLGIKATVIVPGNAPRTKMEAIKNYGATLRILGKDYSEAEIQARELEKETGMIFISPYNDAGVITGQGTIGLEILDEKPDIDIIVAPVGGGGLISGVSVAAKSIKPSIQIIGVQSETSPVIYESLKAGKIVDMELEESIAEGLHGLLEKDTISFDFIKDHVDDVVLVSEDEIKAAIKLFLKTHGLVVEGAGAVGLAALPRYKELFKGKKTAVLVTGRNIDGELLRKIVCG